MVSRKSLSLVSCYCILVAAAKADVDSIGPDGIRSSLLDLTGAGVAIAQVEAGRPGIDSDDYTHEQAIPFQFFAGTNFDGIDSQFIKARLKNNLAVCQRPPAPTAAMGHDDSSPNFVSGFEIPGLITIQFHALASVATPERWYTPTRCRRHHSY
jgi:hypothetical protein